MARRAVHGKPRLECITYRQRAVRRLMGHLRMTFDATTELLADQPDKRGVVRVVDGKAIDSPLSYDTFSLDLHRIPLLLISAKTVLQLAFSRGESGDDLGAQRGRRTISLDLGAYRPLSEGWWHTGHACPRREQISSVGVDLCWRQNNVQARIEALEQLDHAGIASLRQGGHSLLEVRHVCTRIFRYAHMVVHFGQWLYMGECNDVCNDSSQ